MSIKVRRLFESLILFLSLCMFSCRTYNDVLKAQMEVKSQAKAEQERKLFLDWQTRDEYISAAKSAWSLIENETNPKVFENYLLHYYNGDIYYFLYEPALLKIAESYTDAHSTADNFGLTSTYTNSRKIARIEKNANNGMDKDLKVDDNSVLSEKKPESTALIHFVHNYGLGLNPTVILDTRKPEDQFIPGNIYIFDFLYINRKVGNSLLADTAYWAPTEIENSIGLNRTEIFLRNAPDSFRSYTRNWYVILRYVGETRVFTVNGTSDIIESFDVLWFNPFFDEKR